MQSVYSAAPADLENAIRCLTVNIKTPQNRKNVYLSPNVEEPLNSKVIKSFVPELRSPKCFSRFEIPMFYVKKFSFV